MIWTASFWKGAAERGIKTCAQALVAIISAGTVGILDVDWTAALSVAALAALASLLTSIGNADFTAGTPPVMEAPEVVALMADDPEAQVRFQAALLAQPGRTGDE